MFETCEDIQGLFSGYIDGCCDREQVIAIRYHLDLCAACRKQLDEYRSVQCELRGLRRCQIPGGLSLQLRVLLSQHLHDDWLSRWQVRYQNSLKPLLVPATGGVLAAILSFALLFGSNTMPLPPVQRPDVPIALVTPPRLRQLPPINFNTEDNQLVLMTRVNAAGQVTGYDVLSGKISPELRYQLDRLIYFSVFEPATTFGTPTDGKVLLSLSRITVRG